MYTEQDKVQIAKRIKRYALRTLPMIAALIALYVVCMIQRWEIVAMLDGAMIFAACCFAWVMYLYPCIRYRRFLQDMHEGLTREVEGSVVQIAEQEEMQDGVRVLPVRVCLAKEQDERIVYLNVTKRDQFPTEGVNVKLDCFGRHIKGVTVV